MAAPNRGQGLQNGLWSDAVAREDFGSGVTLECGERHEQVFGRNVLVLERGGLIESAAEDVLGGWAQVGLRDAGDFRQLAEGELDIGGEGLRANTQFRQQGWQDAVALLGQRCQQVRRLNLLLLMTGSAFLRGRKRLLGLHRESVKTKHGCFCSCAP